MRLTHLALLCVVLSLRLGAQDDLRRMDPSDWFALDDVQTSWELLLAEKEHHWAGISCNSGTMEMVAGSRGAWFNRVDDMRMVMDSTGAIIGRSHNHGFNLGARHFYWNNRYFAIGGAGFWKRHSMLLEFIKSTGEWEWLMAKGEPEYCLKRGTWLDAGADRVVAMDPADGGFPNNKNRRLVHALDLVTNVWAPLGMANPLLDIHLTDQRAQPIDFESYFFWVGLHKAVIVRKSDLMAVVTVDFNRSMIAPPVINENGQRGFILSTTDNGRFQKLQMVNADSEWHVLADFDVVASFEAGLEDAVPFVVPIPAEALGQEEVTTSSAAPLPIGGWALFALVLSGGAFVLGRRVSLRQEPEAGMEVSTPEPKNGVAPSNGNHSFSQLTKRFVAFGEGVMDTAQLNKFLGLDAEQSEETKRSRRAQAIREVNNEYRVFHGQILIVREQDKADRRRTNYLIQPCSDNA